MGKKRVISDIGSTDFYKHFVAKHKKDNRMFHITKGEFTSLMEKIFDKITTAMVENGESLRMPAKMGDLYIRKEKMKFLNPNKLSVNWKLTEELWDNDPEARINKTLIRHINNHTDNHKCYWYFNNYYCLIPNKSAYFFRAMRRNSRKLGDHLNKTNDYTKYLN